MSVPTSYSITLNLDEILRIIHYVHMAGYIEGHDKIDKDILSKLIQTRNELKSLDESPIT